MIDMPYDILKEAYQNELAYGKVIRDENRANLERAVMAEQQRRTVIVDAHDARRSLEHRISLLREWIRVEGERTDTCTFHILDCEICSNCRCERGNGRTKAL